MTLLTLDGVACTAADGTPLFSGLDLSIGDTVGLVGRNGAGKTTLLHAIAGLAPVAAGTMTRGGRVGLLRQAPADADLPLAEALGAGTALAVLDRIERGLAGDQDHLDADWSLPARLDKALAAVELFSPDLARPLGSLSGGEQSRLMLAALLLEEPDMLLMDEPTNNMDAEGRRAIARLLDGWTGGALVASHDRELLRAMDRIVELTGTGIHVVGGGWDAFAADRDARRERASAQLAEARHEAARTARERQREKEKQDRRDARGRRVAASGGDPKILLGARRRQAEQTSGRYRKLGDDLAERAAGELRAAQERIERIDPVRIALPPCRVPGDRVLVRAEGLVCRRGGRQVFGPIELTIRGPERIALTGRNGAGKSSLIRLILGQDAPAAGSIAADLARVALLDQRLELIAGATTLADAMARANPDFARHDIHAALAAYGFRNRWADRHVATLSGGEQVRLALACLFSRPRPPQLLILDEPTNHLDLAATELLEAALAGYDGAILCVSHDAAFRQAIRLTRTVAL